MTNLEQATDKDTNRLCRYCVKNISTEAKVCHHCGRHQNRIVQYSDRIGLLVSIIMLLIAFSQLREARQERVAASDAVTKAQQAERSTKSLHEAFRQQALVMTRIEWLNLETSMEIGTERSRKAAEQILKDINLVLRWAIPDQDKRTIWIKELKGTIPARK